MIDSKIPTHISVKVKVGILCLGLCYNCDLRVKIASVGETGSSGCEWIRGPEPEPELRAVGTQTSDSEGQPALLARSEGG